MEKKIKVKAERNQKKEDNKCIQKDNSGSNSDYFDKDSVSSSYYATLCGDFRVQLGDLIVECMEQKHGYGVLYVIQNTTVNSIVLERDDNVVREIKLDATSIEEENIFVSNSDASSRQMLIDEMLENTNT